MKKVLFFCLLIVCFSSSYSQSNYQTALGVKFYPGAITVKHFVQENAAVEGLAYFWYYGMRITGLYEFHKDINGVDGLQWYVGPGAHVGFWNNHWKDSYNNYYNTHPYSGAYLGIDGVLGLDYKISTAPINLSLDWQPAFNFGRGPAYYGFYSGFGGLAIRYTLK
jgi:hypothetical protein